MCFGGTAHRNYEQNTIFKNRCLINISRHMKILYRNLTIFSLSITNIKFNPTMGYYYYVPWHGGSAKARPARETNDPGFQKFSKENRLS